ncbi:MAG: ATP-grasp domain-containing protein [bacterium]
MKIREKISNSIVQISIICVYIPIYLQIIYLSLQHKKSPSVLWKVNPGFPYGGIICSKSFVVQRFLQKKENTRFFTKTLSVSKIHTQEEKIKKIEQFMQKEKIHYPIILKPDDGIGGVGVLFIQNKNDLKKNIKNINKDYLVQEYVSRDQELSLFFVKNPQQKK